MADFVGIEIAIVIVTASIILSGILIGLGRAFGYKKVEHFGIEELLQSIVNAAIIGSFAVIIELVDAVSSSIVGDSCPIGNAISQLSCTLDALTVSLFSFFSELVKTSNLVGYYQTLSLNFGSFSISPFTNLSSVSSVLSLQILLTNLIILFLQLNSQIAIFIGQNALGLLFPVGLVLRTFFATRRVGGFMIALSLGLFIFYPAFILIFPTPIYEIDNSSINMVNFTNNSYYAPIPVVDLNDNYAIAGKLDIMSGRCTNSSNSTGCLSQNISQENFTLENLSVDFSSDLTVITQSNNVALSKSLLYSVIAPMFSLILTFVFVRELTSVLGSEITFKTIASI